MKDEAGNLNSLSGFTLERVCKWMFEPADWEDVVLTVSDVVK